jgi:hypothetical protein
MSTTFTTALSTPVVNNNNTTTILRNKQQQSKLFFSQLYHYVSITFRFICSLFTLPSNTTKLIVQQNKKNIPTNTTTTAMQYYKGKTLILDLDETLVHSVRLGSESSFNEVSPSVISKKIEVQCDKQSLLYQVYKRPHVDFFLKTVSYIYICGVCIWI